MSDGLAVEERRRRFTRSCQHHWIIETPHGATSRGLCKRCGATKRFPNAAEDAMWQAGGGRLGRWATRRGALRPTQIRLRGSNDKA